MILQKKHAIFSCWRSSIACTLPKENNQGEYVGLIVIREAVGAGALDQQKRHI